VNRDLEELATAWATSQEIAGERTEAEWAPIFAVHDLLGDAERLWEFVLVAEPLCISEAAFGMLGTGPLEDLIQDHGEAFVDRIEQQAKENPRFARLFEHVWVPAGRDPITLRYLALGCTEVGPHA
jgi:hypothetical protein